MKRIIVFASGNGSNAVNLIKYFAQEHLIKVTDIFCNNPKARVISKGKTLKIPVHIFTKTALNEGNILNELKSLNPDLIILAGFILKIPTDIINHFKGRIINIHPSLLPKYGGKGMYGQYVHEQVLKNNEKKSGITIHLVDEVYDNGRILFQKEIAVGPEDTLDTLSEKIHKLEHNYFPKVIKDYLLGIRN